MNLINQKFYIVPWTTISLITPNVHILMQSSIYIIAITDVTYMEEQ